MLALRVHERAGLDGGAHRDHLVGVDPRHGLLLEIVLHAGADDGQPRRAADEDHGVEVGGRHPRGLERLVAHLEGALHEIHHHAVEFRLAEIRFQIHHLAGGILADAFDLDPRERVPADVDLGALGRFLQHLQAVLVEAEVDPLLLEEVVREPRHDAVVEVVAAQVRVAGGGEHLEDVLADLEDRDVEGTAAQVVDRDLLRDLLAESIGERRRGRLVQDAQHLETGDAAGVLGRLALVVVEVGGHGDHRLLHFVAQVVLDDRLHLLQHQRGDLGQRVDVVADLDADGVVLALDDLVRHHRLRLLHFVGEVEAADEALRAVDGVVGVGDDVALGAVPDEHRPVVEEADHGGVGALAPLVPDHHGLTALDDRNAAVARA